MKFQVLQDGHGNNTGVFMPIEKWNLKKEQYSDIEDSLIDFSQWEKGLIDERLKIIEENPERLKNGKYLFQESRFNVLHIKISRRSIERH